MKRLWRFMGGLHLPGHKGLSTGQGVQPLPAPHRVMLPLKQHIGAPAQPVVAVGDRVDKGQLIAAAASFISAPVHASVSGRVVEIGAHTLPHPSGIAEDCIVIESDGEDRWSPDITAIADPASLSVEQLRDRIRKAGVVGLGGAVFPSAAKLSPPRKVDTLIINGVECEPYITCDDMLMRSRADDVLRGSLLLLRIVAATRCLIALEDNKPQALASLRDALARYRALSGMAADTVEVVAVPTVFPAGGEKQLIKVLTGREVPVGGLPYEIGAVCLNVGTTVAVHDAVYLGRPLVSRLVTVTGSAVRQPGNFEVPLGTPVADLLAAAGGATGRDVQLLMGGPMMGQALPGDQVMVVKGSNCILVQPPAKPEHAMPCIRCGSCANACPMQLLPQQLYWHARGKQLDDLARYNLDSCIECGCCTVVCPSKIPLVSYFRFAKTEIADRADKRQRAAESRSRNEIRLQRLEAQQRAQAERKAQRKANRRPRKPPAAVQSGAEQAATAPQASQEST